MHTAEHAQKTCILHYHKWDNMLVSNFLMPIYPSWKLFGGSKHNPNPITYSCVPPYEYIIRAEYMEILFSVYDGFNEFSFRFVLNEREQ